VGNRFEEDGSYCYKTCIDIDKPEDKVIELLGAI